MDYQNYVNKICIATKNASRNIMSYLSNEKDNILELISKKILENKDEIIKANKIDLENGKNNNLSNAMLDRLMLDESRLKKISDSVLEIKNLPDPVGEIEYSTRRPNGLEIRQVRVPIGVVGMIYESRPNVTIDAASLCIKSGNAVILRGGKEAINSNSAFVKTIKEALIENNSDPDIVGFIDNSDRNIVTELLKQKQFIDVIVPRGGEGLIKFVSENSHIPVIKHDKGLCNIYIEKDAIKEWAVNITENAKVQRPGVCNAVENIIIHKDFPYINDVIENLINKGVEIRGDSKTVNINNKVIPANEEDWDTEYLDLIVSIKIVDELKQAIDFINLHNSGHTESIITNDYVKAKHFRNKVDSACIMVNASTRFSDGGEFGLGAEVGISTQKLHVRGPMGIRDLTCLKYIIEGEGNIRE